MHLSSKLLLATPHNAAFSKTKENSSIIFKAWLDRLHLMQSRADLKIINDNLYLITAITFSQLSLNFSAFFWAICLWNIKHSEPNTSLTENSNGVTVPCSMFIIRLLHSRFFSFSCLNNTLSIFTLWCDAELVLIIWISEMRFDHLSIHP